MSEESPDAINGIMIGQPGAVGMSIIAGKVNNGLRCTQRVALETGPQALLACTTNQDFTICGWLSPGTAATSCLIDYFNDNVSSEVFVAFESGTGGGSFAGRITAAIATNSYITLNVNGVTPSPGSGWFFFLMEVRNGILGVQINNGILYTEPSQQAVWAGDTSAELVITTQDRGDAFHTWQLDEIAFMKGALSDEQKATLYNSGNGVTWPVDLT